MIRMKSARQHRKSPVHTGRKKITINRVGDHCFATLTGTSREIAKDIMAIGNILWTKKRKGR